jgi:hypothetical protein
MDIPLCYTDSDGTRAMGIPCRNQEILKQVQDDIGWTFHFALTGSDGTRAMGIPPMHRLWYNRASRIKNIASLKIFSQLLSVITKL